MSEATSGNSNSQGDPCAAPRCPRCGNVTRPEHAHNKCDTCGYIVPCCEPGSGG